jgi:signal transduction histidine kinase/PAS domain-containing protein
MTATRRSAKRDATAQPTWLDSASLLDATFDVITDPLYVTDADGTITRTNAAFRAIMGLPADYFTQPFAERAQRFAVSDSAGNPMPPEAWPLQRVLRGETVTRDNEADLLMTLPDGRCVWISPNGNALRDPDGTIVGAVMVYYDVTARRAAEATLGASEARFQAKAKEAQEQILAMEGVFSAITAAIVVFDRHGTITRVNPAAQQLYDLAGGPTFQQRPMHERAVNMALYNDSGTLLPPERWPGQRVLAGETIAEEEVQFHAQDGRLFVLSLAGVALRDANGTITGGVTVYQDMTARRQLERRTHTSLDALLLMAQRAVQAGGDIHVAAHDIAEVTCEVLGCRRVGVMQIAEETQIIVPLTVVGLSPEEEREWWATQPTEARYGEGGDPEQVARFAAGEPLVIDMTQPPFDQAPNPFGITTALFLPLRLDERLVGILSLDHAGVPHDYSDDEIALARGMADLAALVIERERLQAAHAAAQAKALALTETNARMHTFLGIAGHELRTPITSIKTSVQLSARVVKQTLDHEVPETLKSRLARAAQLLDGANSQANKLNRFIADLLDVTRIQSGTLEMHPTVVDFTSIVREATDAQQLDWPGRVLTVALPAQPVQVWGDADRLGQVVTNLVTNALKYSAEDQPVQVQLTVTGQQARLAISDHGPGLSTRQQAELFQAFGRLDGIQPQNGAGVGLGLGLFICKTIIEGHGGRMGVASQPGTGATFWCSLALMNDQTMQA